MSKQFCCINIAELCSNDSLIVSRITDFLRYLSLNDTFREDKILFIWKEYFETELGKLPRTQKKTVYMVSAIACNHATDNGKVKSHFSNPVELKSGCSSLHFEASINHIFLPVSIF